MLNTRKRRDNDVEDFSMTVCAAAPTLGHFSVADRSSLLVFYWSLVLQFLWMNIHTNNHGVFKHL